MRKIVTLRSQGNPSTIYARFNDPLDRVEAQRVAWLDYRVRLREFKADSSLDNETKALAARDAWHAAWRAANPL